MGLKAGDLRHLASEVFEIDSFASKMGDDKNIITVSFSLQEKQAADDLANFLEKGYTFVLDADATPGEQSDGTYKVFVELERSKEAHDHIMEIIDGVQKVTERELKFRYYKDWHSKEATLENISSIVPLDPENYGVIAVESNLNNFKNFFNKSFVDSVEMLENTLTIKRKYADPLRFQFVDFGDRNTILENIEGKFDLMESYPEILFLTKYIGEYHISKYGDKLVFENESKALVIKRI